MEINKPESNNVQVAVNSQVRRREGAIASCADAKGRLIIGLTGYGGAGKSTAAKYLSEALQLPYYGLGTYERSKFGHIGTPCEYHRKLGVDVTYYGIYTEHIEQIAAKMSGSGIILESLYASSFVDLLKTTFNGIDVKIIHISAPRELRISNMVARTNLALDAATVQLDDLDSIKIGFGMLDTIRKADLTVKNSSELSKFLKDTHKEVARLLRLKIGV